jgi:hypothetical protein
MAKMENTQKQRLDSLLIIVLSLFNTYFLFGKGCRGTGVLGRCHPTFFVFSTSQAYHMVALRGKTAKFLSTTAFTQGDFPGHDERLRDGRSDAGQSDAGPDHSGDRIPES